jgi:hypothetical protein
VPAKRPRFVVSRMALAEKNEAFQRFARENFGDADEWQCFCEEHGHDPSAEFFDVPADYPAPRGASTVPPEPLPTIVGVAFVAGMSVEELVRLLHPEPSPEVVEELAAVAGRLGKDVERLATGVRGGSLTRGPKPSDVSADEHRAARYIGARRALGATDDQIFEELCATPTPISPMPALTQDDVARLAALDLG